MGQRHLAVYSDNGVIFGVNTDGSDFRIVHDFSGADPVNFTNSDGACPGGLILSGNTFYGTTSAGGTGAYGTVFKVNTDGTGFTVVYNFSADNPTGSPNGGGAEPDGNLVLSGSTLYGTACVGGAYGSGTVFALNTNGMAFRTLVDFDYGWGGAWPVGLLLLGNTLYVTLSAGGGDFGLAGVIFALDIVSGRGHPVYGVPACPDAGLISSGNILYGTAEDVVPENEGIVFAVNTNGSSFVTLHSFTNADGGYPDGGLVLSGTTLYGTTPEGGSSSNGTVFAVNTDGTGFTNLHNFTATRGSIGCTGTNSDGAWPGALTLSGNTLYGTTYYGGSGGNGTVFALSLARSVPTITTQPQSQTAQVGSNVAFSVVASGVPSPNYQWQFNGQNLAGQTAASLSLTNVQFGNGGGYLVIVTNAYGSVTSAVAQLTVFTNLVVVQTNRTPTTNEIGQPTIPTDTNHFKAYNNGNFKSGIALNPNKMTVVLTHGWNGSPSDWAAYTAQIIQQRIGVNAVNIVAWDWSAEAQSVWYELGAIAAKTTGEGEALGTDLIAALGSKYSQRIHFIGHSLGTLVNAAAANYVHANGYSWTNTQMTLCDEAEVAWTFTSAGWQMATTLPEIVQQGVSTLETFDGNFSTPQPGWAHPLPNQFAWADNYVSAFGLLHSGAANVILTYTYPSSLPEVNTVVQEFYNFHDYAHFSYEDTIEPGLFNTGGQTNATYAGFVCSFEGGGFAGRPGTNTYFYQDPGGLELNLVQKDLAFATNFLNARFRIYQLIGITTLPSQGENGVFGAVAQAVGQVNGQIESTGQDLENMVLNLFTSVSGGSRIGNRGSHPSGGPVPKRGGSGNTPRMRGCR